jgi:diadenosine tetraphosphate (Ap4A) HIT family hydrolase
MLMMVDPEVHFHVIPRYSMPRSWKGIEFADAGWPGPPRLDVAVKLDAGQLSQLVADLGADPA